MTERNILDHALEALRPFVEFARHIAEQHPGWDHDGFTTDRQLTKHCGLPTMKEYRRAAAAVEAIEKMKGDVNGKQE